MQAQECCFRIINPNGGTLTGLANVPEGLPLNHSLEQPQPGNSDIYNLQFADCSIFANDQKISLEWELIVDGQSLSTQEAAAYCSITFQSRYNELNWIGEELTWTDNYGHTHAINEYPGANGHLTGTYNISNIHFDFFYFHFLKYTQTRLIINWRQYIQDAKFVVHVRQRTGGTNNELHYDAADTKELGGHQSFPGSIIASDTIDNRAYAYSETTINSCEPVTVGKPAYTMDITGNYKIAYVSTYCGTRIDSIVLYHFHHYVHPTTPTLSDSTFRFCQFTQNVQINLSADPNPTLAQNDIRPIWYNGTTEILNNPFNVPTDVDGNFNYSVKRHDYTTGCESELDTFQVTIVREPDAPIVVDRNIGYCVGDAPTQLSYTAPAGQQVLWGTTRDNITSTVAPTPTTTAAGVQCYYLKLQETTPTMCVSAGYDSILVHVYDNPVVSLTTDKDEMCFDSVATLTATADMTTYKWFMNGTTMTTPNVNVINVTNDNNTGAAITNKFFVYVEKANTYKTCHNSSDTVAVIYDSKMGAPVATDPAPVCGPNDVTCTATLGTAATGVKWYAADKATVLATTLSYTAHYDQNAVLYVSSVNDFGCESDASEWTMVTVKVNDVPHITITHDDRVCAESDMIISSSIVDTTSATFTYAWNGVGLVAPLDQANVTFNYNVAGTYVDTLVVTDGNGCEALATTTVVVDSLPIIVKDVNYTVTNDDYCVNHNGKIIFTTPDYEGYKIRTADAWSTGKEFLGLAPGTYQLSVKDSYGCVSHENIEVLIQDTTDLSGMTADLTKNTRCSEEFNPWNGSITVVGLPTPTVGSYEYRLNGGAVQTTTLFAGLKSDTYTVEARNTVTGCKVAKDFTVEDSLTYPVPTLAIVDNDHCVAPYGGSIAVTAVDPEGTYKYKLEGGVYGTDTVFTALKDSTYTVYVKNQETACESNSSATVNYAGVLPTGTISGVDHCFTDTTEVSRISFSSTNPAVKFDYWSHDGGLPTGVSFDIYKYQQSFKMIGFPAGDHIFVAHFTDTITHCVNTVTDTIRVNSINFEIRRMSPPISCEYDTVRVFCEPHYTFPGDDQIVSYAWTSYGLPSATYPGHEDTLWVVPNMTTHKVSLSVRDNHGCVNTNQLNLEVTALPRIDSISGALSYCNGATTSLTPYYTLDIHSTSVTEHKWTSGTATIASVRTLAITLKQDTTVTYQLKDNLGCKADTTISIHAVTIPGQPMFNPRNQYFCDTMDVYVDTTQQYNPKIGNFVWNTVSPNEEPANGWFRAHYEYTEGTVTCKSANSAVNVHIEGNPSFTLKLKYNSVEKTQDSICVRETPGTITIDATSGDASLAYIYTMNGDTLTSTTYTIPDSIKSIPGTYTYKVKVTATKTHPDANTCSTTDSSTFTFKVNGKPAKPVNFPDPYMGAGNPTVFYCQSAGAASYSFTIPTGSTAVYNPGNRSVAPTTEETGIYMKITNEFGCDTSYKYDIIQILTPHANITDDVDPVYCSGTSVPANLYATSTNSYSPEYLRTYTWTGSPLDTVIRAKYQDKDTLTTSFSADDTVWVDMSVYVANGSYSQTCYSTSKGEFKIAFQDLPGKPSLRSTCYFYHSSDTAFYCNEKTIYIDKSNFDWYRKGLSTLHFFKGTTEIPSIINSPGTYKVFATNNDSPYCSGDTLTFVVIKNRALTPPTDFASYSNTVKYCASDDTASYDFGPVSNPADKITYLSGPSVIAKPKTAGSYTLRVTDTTALRTTVYPTCIKDFNYTIQVVADPTVNITSMSPDWENMKYCEGTPIPAKAYMSNVTETHQGSKALSYKWTVNGDSVSNLNTFNSNLSLDPITANDSIQHFVTISDTTKWGTGHKIVCHAHDTSSVLIWYFYKKLGAPTQNVADTVNYCKGDTVLVTFTDTNSLTLPFAHELNKHDALDIHAYNDTVFLANRIHRIFVKYSDLPSCTSDTNHSVLTMKQLPEITISHTPVTDTICLGDSITLRATATTFPVTLGYTYVWGDTISTSDNVRVPSGIYTVTATDTVYGCSSSKSDTIYNYPKIQVTLSPDTMVCKDAFAYICATPSTYYDYQWYRDGLADTIVACPGFVPQPYLSSVSSAGVITPFEYSLEVTDEHGCVSPRDSNKMYVTVANNPVISFYNNGGYDPIAHTGTEIDHLDTRVGEASPFEMVINTNCWKPDERIYLHFQFVKDDTVIMMDNSTVLGVCAGVSNTTYDIYTSDCAPMVINAPGYSTAFGNVPNNNFIATESQPYNWFYLHFMNQRRIKVNMGNWLQSGKYSIVYTIIKANSSAAENYQYYLPGMVLGGNNGVPGTEVVSYGVMTFNVDTASAGNADIESPTAITTFDTKAEMSMQVYPNPANNHVNVAVSGLQGQSILAVYDMSGKAVTSQTINVDYEGQIFNLNVDNFSQGIYFIKVVNGNAVMTKKLIIAR